MGGGRRELEETNWAMSTTTPNVTSTLRMRKWLNGATAHFPRLEAAMLAPFKVDLHLAHVHSLLQEAYTELQEAYTDGFGQVPELEVWWREISEDSEFDLTLLTVAVDEGGELLGFIHSWNSAFIKDLAISKAARRRGFGSALLHHSFAAFHVRGSDAVDLKVMAANIPAVALYRSAGMVEVNEES